VVTCPVLVAMGDIVEGSVEIIAPDTGDGDEWAIDIWDTDNSGIDTQEIDVRTGSENPAFRTAFLSVLEVHGLTACAGLSTTNVDYFVMNTLDQEGSTWNSFDNVQNLITVGSFWGGWTPSCSFGAAADYESSSGKWFLGVSGNY
jgi:hypothetical protein